MKDSYQKWIAGVVGAGIVSLLGYLVIQDRQNIDKDIQALKAHDAAFEATIEIIQQDNAVSKVQHDYLVLSVNELKDGQKDIDRKLNVVVQHTR